MSGDIVAQNNQLILSSHDAEESVQVFQEIETDLNGQKFRLQATLASKNVIPGKEEWNKARLLLVQYIDDEAQWKFSHVLAALEGTHEWQRFREVFSISPGCSELRVIAQMNRSSGELFVKDLNLYEVVETTIYPWVNWLVKSAWILFILVLFVPRLKGNGSILLKTCIILTVAGVVVGTTLPGTVKNELKNDITTEMQTYTPPVNKAAEVAEDPAQHALYKLDITKIAHFCFFALLAFLLLLNNPFLPVPLILLELLMLACATELLQFYVDGRSPLITDALIDMAGALAVVSLAGRNISGRRITAQ